MTPSLKFTLSALHHISTGHLSAGKRHKVFGETINLTMPPDIIKSTAGRVFTVITLIMHLYPAITRAQSINETQPTSIKRLITKISKITGIDPVKTEHLLSATFLRQDEMRAYEQLRTIPSRFVELNMASIDLSRPIKEGAATTGPSLRILLSNTQFAARPKDILGIHSEATLFSPPHPNDAQKMTVWLVEATPELGFFGTRADCLSGVTL
ncbi:MAG: hypothetical protein Q4G14_04300 [Paracoccus sp. (in: a-proteobacteria)]|uniref:hypothetical protein n=1 Tax=Paracoccus sp. TaxID=267 RepID=UPI0026DF37F2|nr:hypothetical protein [Paracoccus sp. (in: a-proteobacteria)]MDO5612451.1 hypothetical protein [Paracoccus sp. (in: a-proteobacteria)]